MQRLSSWLLSWGCPSRDAKTDTCGDCRADKTSTYAVAHYARYDEADVTCADVQRADRSVCLPERRHMRRAFVLHRWGLLRLQHRPARLARYTSPSLPGQACAAIASCLYRLSANVRCVGSSCGLGQGSARCRDPTRYTRGLASRLGDCCRQ